MKSVWITYDEKDYEINKGFVDLFRKAFLELSAPYEIKVVLSETLQVSVLDGKTVFFVDQVKEAYPAFVIARTRDFRLSRMIERAGIRVFNSSRVCEICNDKAVTYQEVSKLGIPMLDTWFDHIPKELSYPYVAKPVDGHGGIGVSMIHDEKEKEAFLHQMKCGEQMRRYVVQRPTSELGKDVRVYVMGGKIIQAMCRKSDSDFRSNFCLGGKATCVELTETEICYVETLQEHFQFDFAGIDFIYDQGKAVFNEIEDVVGSRMLYTHTDIDIVKMYSNYLLQTMCE